MCNVEISIADVLWRRGDWRVCFVVDDKHVYAVLFENAQ